MSQPQGYGRENCILLAVLCGQFADRRRGDAKNRPQYPFPELVSSGRLEVTSSFHVFVPFVFHKVWGGSGFRYGFLVKKFVILLFKCRSRHSLILQLIDLVKLRN